MNCTRLDIICAIGILSRFISNPSHDHWKETSRLMRYLKYILHYGLHYKYSFPILECYMMLPGLQIKLIIDQLVADYLLLFVLLLLGHLKK